MLLPPNVAVSVGTLGNWASSLLMRTSSLTPTHFQDVHLLSGGGLFHRIAAVEPVGREVRAGAIPRPEYQLGLLSNSDASGLTEGPTSSEDLQFAWSSLCSVGPSSTHCCSMIGPGRAPAWEGLPWPFWAAALRACVPVRHSAIESRLGVISITRGDGCTGESFGQSGSCATTWRHLSFAVILLSPDLGICQRHANYWPVRDDSNAYRRQSRDN